MTTVTEYCMVLALVAAGIVLAFGICIVCGC
jgi:hypothetical protein